MKFSKFFPGLYLSIGLTITSSAWADSQYPYYYGAYPSESGSNNTTDNPNTTHAQQPQPPVIYQPVPVYRPVIVHRAPPWASPSDAALGPWAWNFDIGGGPVTATGANNPVTGGSNFQFGTGYNVSPRAGFVLEFMNDWLGVTDTALQQNGAVDGHANIWSVTLNPIWRFRIGGPVGGYLIGGGGYYRRDLQFDEPFQAFVPSFNGGFIVSGTQWVNEYDDAGGVNIGGGLTWNVGWGTKFFVEARYHHIFTSGSATELIPITLGLRW